MLAAPEPAAFLIGLRYAHHARHSGYDGFSRYVGTWLDPPLRSRTLRGRAGCAVDSGVARLVGKHRYSLASMLAEMAAGLHAVRRDHSLYHVLYAERDLMLLRRLGGVRGHRLVATFHKPPGVEPMSFRWVSDTLCAALLVSEYQRSYFRSLLPDDRLFVVPHGIDTYFFRPPEEGQREPTCITVGAHLRDLRTLARAIPLIWQERPETRFTLVGVGHSPHLRPVLRDSRVRLLSEISDEALRAAYQQARVGVFAFEQATASNALLEAMACGLPVVASAVGGVPEYVREDTGSLVARSDPEELARGVVRYLDDPRLAEAHGTAARAAALRHDYSVVAGELRLVYERLLANGAG